MRAVVRSAVRSAAAALVVALVVALRPGVASTTATPTWRVSVVHVRGGGALAAISCASESACVAVGSSVGADARPHALVAALASGRWRTAVLAQPSGTVASGLSGVSCAVARCVAVGDVVLSNGTDRPSIWVVAGATWRRVALSYPAGFTAGTLVAISCPSATACVAVGSWQGRGTSAQHELVETLSGGRWTPSTVAAPSGASAWVVGGVACGSPTQCVAVGTAVVGATQVVARDRLSGRTWRAARLAVPGGELDPQLLGVSCAGGWCLAVGDVRQPDGSDQFPLAESGSSAWSASTPHATGSHWEALAAASCTARAWCEAVGPGGEGQHGAPALVAGVHDGRWALRTLAAPPGTTDGTLAGISCRGAACTAVGVVDQGGTHEPLVARYA